MLQKFRRKVEVENEELRSQVNTKGPSDGYFPRVSELYRDTSFPPPDPENMELMRRRLEAMKSCR